MNIFEDLIEELKEENLLEETVIETTQAEENAKQDAENAAEDAPVFSSDDVEEPESDGQNDDEILSSQEVYENESPDEFVSDEFVSDEPVSESSFEIAEAPADVETSEEDLSGEMKAEDFSEETFGENVSEEESEENLSEEIAAENLAEAEVEDAETAAAVAELGASKPVNKVEFYRQRAMKEVSGLQMVDHVLSGIEREQMKVMPKPYDDLEVKKILHNFMQVSGDLNSPEHAQAEFKLMQETESWYSALSHRDKSISVTHLRRYCETTRPVLSSQALISLARFYRNSPYSEAVRAKFDLIITRLFAKEIGDSVRKMVFGREEMIKHLTTLYAEWSSVPLYAANEDDSEILLMTLKFEDFMHEADNAGTFDELIKNDFFNRLRMFKESTNENFFAPLLTATAIECNVRVGNRYVELIQVEKEKTESDRLQDKYGFLHDQSISEAASMSLHLVDLLKQRGEEDDEDFVEQPQPEVIKDENVAAQKAPYAVAPQVGKQAKKKRGLFAVNKWLLFATLLIVIANAGLYIWSKKFDTDADVVKNVKAVNLENSMLKDHVREGRIANDIFFGVVQPNWAGLNDEKKEDILKKVLSAGVEKGFSRVHLLDSQGKTVGYADVSKVEVR